MVDTCGWSHSDDDPKGDMREITEEADREIGERLRGARKEAGLSQDELGNRIGFSGKMVSAVELGKRRLPIAKVFRAARVLKIDPRLLLPSGLGDIDQQEARLLELFSTVPQDKKEKALEMFEKLLDWSDLAEK